jgi:uncharacterized protein
MTSVPFYLVQIVGIFSSSLFLITTAQAASFDCENAKSEVEKLICIDEELSRLDETLKETYREALTWTDNKKQLIQSQWQGLKKKRNACLNAESP